jgi:hypothetical protein
MRYEAKHGYFKRLAMFMGNYTNVAVSQTRSCYLMSTQADRPRDDHLVKKPKIGNLQNSVISDILLN